MSMCDYPIVNESAELSSASFAIPRTDLPSQYEVHFCSKRIHKEFSPLYIKERLREQFTGADAKSNALARGTP